MNPMETQWTKELYDFKIFMAEISKDVKYIQERVDDQAETIRSIASLTGTVEKMSAAMELVTTQFNASVSSLREHIERVEAKLSESAKRAGQRLEALEKEPAGKWRAMTAQLISLIVAAVAGYFISRFLN